MTERPCGWNKHEAAILLEGLLEVLDNGASRKEIIKRVSYDLRKMACQQGEEIDEVFRNENGIFFQMESMESVLKGYTATKKPATKLFTQVVNLYKTDRPEYDKILGEAKAMVNKNQSCEDDFMAWLSKKASPTQLPELRRCYAEIETSCLNAAILKKPLFETIDCSTIHQVQQYIERNKLFHIKHLQQYARLASAGRYYFTYVKEMAAKKQTTRERIPEPPKKAAAVEITKETAASMPEKEATVIKPETAEIPASKEEPSVEEQAASAERDDAGRKSTEQPEKESQQSAAVNRSTFYQYLTKTKKLSQSMSWNYSCAIGDCEMFAKEHHYESWRLFTSDFSEAKATADALFRDSKFAGYNNRRYNQLSAAITKLLAFIGGDGAAKMGAPAPVSARTVAPVPDKEPNNRDEPYENVGNGCQFSEEIIPHEDEEKKEPAACADAPILEQEDLTVDFEHFDIYAYTRPYSFAYFEERKEPCSSWAELYVMFFASLVEDYPQVFSPGMSFSPHKGRVELTTRDKADSMVAPKPVPGTDYVIETNVSAGYIVRKMKYLMDLCAVDYENVVVRYYRKTAAEEPIGPETTQPGKETQQPADGAAEMDISEPVPAHAVAPVPDKEPKYRNEPYETVLRETFRKGFRLDSPIELCRFKKSFYDINGAQLEERDEEIVGVIRRLCVLHKDRAYLPDVMLSEELKEKLLSYIEDSFDSGKNAIYFRAICEKFAEDFLDYPLHNDPDALKAYLSHVGNGRFCINRSFISREANVTADALTELRACLQGYGRPVDYAELFAALPHLPQRKIKNLLLSKDEFINNGQGVYFHESAIKLSEEELKDIAQIIEQTIADKDFIGGNELYEAIQAKYPYIIENNYEFSVYGFRDALKYKFGNRFSFKGNIISAAGKELSMTDVFANYARKHDSFTLAELEMLAADLSSPIYFDAVYENSLRISKEQFVSKKQAQFNVTDTDAAIDRVCVGDYVAISRVNNFGIFPYAGFPWNSFLLEHYVYAYSKDYRLLNAGFHKTECTSAIVKRSIGIDNLDDFIVLLLTDADVELEKAPVLQFLVDNGYLARRRYTNIEKLIIRARAQRNRKETD